MFGFKSVRAGIFYLPIDFLEGSPLTTKDIMANCIVVRAECRYASRTIEYTAISDLFSEVPVGGPIPEYDISLTKGKEGDIAWEFKRKD